MGGINGYPVSLVEGNPPQSTIFPKAYHSSFCAIILNNWYVGLRTLQIVTRCIIIIMQYGGGGIEGELTQEISRERSRHEMEQHDQEVILVSEDEDKDDSSRLAIVIVVVIIAIVFLL